MLTPCADRIMVGTEVHGWISHCYGATNLFLAIGPDRCKGELERVMFYGTYAQAVSIYSLSNFPFL